MEQVSRKSTPLLVVVIVVGVVALLVGIGIEGFVGGLLQGAGVGTIVMGAYFLGMLHGADRAVAEGVEPATWLPSRDRGR